MFCETGELSLFTVMIGIREVIPGFLLAECFCQRIERGLVLRRQICVRITGDGYRLDGNRDGRHHAVGEAYEVVSRDFISRAKIVDKGKRRLVPADFPCAVGGAGNVKLIGHVLLCQADFFAGKRQTIRKERQSQNLLNDLIRVFPYYMTQIKSSQ